MRPPARRGHMGLRPGGNAEKELKDGVRGQRVDDGAQASNLKAEGRGQKSEDRIRNTNSAFRIPHSAFKSVPIIAMTAHAMTGDEQKSLAAGMNGHVTKPIDPDQLLPLCRNGSNRLQSGPSSQKVYPPQEGRR